jgi:hypothetical protein
VDTRLKEIARAAPGDAQWKTLVEGLSDATPDAERLAAYRAVRDAAVLPEDHALFLFGHAAQWMPSDDDLDRHVEAVLRGCGQGDLADLHDYDRRHERGGSSSSARPRRSSPHGCGRGESLTDSWAVSSGPSPRRPCR